VEAAELLLMLVEETLEMYSYCVEAEFPSQGLEVPPVMDMVIPALVMEAGTAQVALEVN
jgi:hypothetical protein